MKAKRPTEDIARARTLYRQYRKLETEYMGLFEKQERVREKRRIAANRYRMAKQAVDSKMFTRGLGSAKLPSARFLY